MSSRPSRGAARLAAILDALPDALLLVNANGTVVNANTIALEAFETPGTALVGRGLLDLLPQFDSKLIPGSMRRPDHIDPRGRTKPTRMVARRTDGTEFPVEVTSANLQNGQQAYDSSGYTGDELLMLVVRDLSGTVDTEAELARSQRQTEMILRAAAEGVVGTDTDGRIVLVNPAAAQILGYRAGELGGRELHTLVLHSRADGSPFPYDESPLADTLRSGRKHRVRGQVLWSKAGEKVPVDLTTAPVRDGDQLVGAVMTFTDRRPYDALVEEKAAAEKRHAEECERLAEEHASELTALRQQHVTEIEELTERHAEELAANEERYAALGEREKDRYEALAARHEQLLTLLGGSLRGPLDELRRELSALAADDAGQLWPEANQVLHHLSAGYSRITTLIDNVLSYQRLDVGSEEITRTKVMLDAVVAAGIDGAVELVGPGRVQFAVHAPPIEAEVDPRRLATALAHLVADVAGVDATGNAPVSASGYMDNTVVVAAAQRGEVARIEVRGPYSGGDPVHEPIVRGIVRAHGGVLQTHQVPGTSGSAYVLEVPLGGGAGAVPADHSGQGQAPAGHGLAALGPAGETHPGPDAQAAEAGAAPVALPAQAPAGGRRARRRASTDAFLEAEGDASAVQSAPTGRRRRRAAEEAPQIPAQAGGEASGGTGRRRGRPAEDAAAAQGSVVTAAEHAAGTAASGAGLGGTVPPQGVPAPTGRRARRGNGEPHALPSGPSALPAPTHTQPTAPNTPSGPNAPGEPAGASGQGSAGAPAPAAQPTGRRRRALAAAAERAAAQESAPRTVFALPPAEADRPSPGPEAPAAPGRAEAVGQVPGQVPAQAVPGTARPEGAPLDAGQRDAGPHGTRHHGAVPHDHADGHTPPQPHPAGAPTGRRRRAVAQPPEPVMPAQQPAPGAQDVPGAPALSPAVPQTGSQGAAQPAAGQPAGAAHTPGQPVPPAQPVPAPAVPGQNPSPLHPAGQNHPSGQGALPAPAQAPAAGGPTAAGTPLPAEATPAQGVPASGMPTPGHQAPEHQAPGNQPSAGPAETGPAETTPAHGAPVAPVPPAHGVQAPGVPAQPAPAVGAPTPQQWPTPEGTPTTPAAGTPVPVPPNGTTGPVPPAAPAPGVPSNGAAPVPPASTPGAPSGATPSHPAAPSAPSAPAAPSAPPAPSAPEAPGAPVPGDAAPAATPMPAAQAPGTPPHGTPTAPGSPAPTSPAPGTPAAGTPLPPEQTPGQAPGHPAARPAGRAQRLAQPLPAETAAPADPNSTQGRAISVRTLGQGVPFSRQAAQVQQHSATPPPHTPGGSGRRRKLGTPPDPAARTEQRPEQGARPHPPAEQPLGQPSPGGSPVPAAPAQPPAGQSRLAQVTEGAGRSYAIGAPDENAAEGPEPLDGPGGAVEVADPPRPQPMDDELPPEPLDNPRRLLVWPAPDATTQQALSDRGYRPVIVHSREEVDAQIAAFPAALFVDPLTGPITRTALQSLRQAAVAAQVPVLVTAGLGQASREAAYGADPAVLLKALAPRDSEQHPPRVLLIEEHAEIALALTAALERRGMQVAQAASDGDAVALAGQFRPNLVVMDLMQMHRRRAGIVDWLRANGQLNRTPLVVYTAAVDQADLPRLASGETVLFLAERSTSTEVQTRIVDLLARIGTN
ncbi:PAS domain-containing protein [Streptomyces mexicanus]|uniref:PAS domain-containing protein n=1 Tax=Streptomyces mexicanus TaxID=178566 RepID=UPI0036575528